MLIVVFRDDLRRRNVEQCYFYFYNLDKNNFQCILGSQYWQVADVFKNRIALENEELIRTIQESVATIQLPKGEAFLAANDTFNAIEKEIARMSPHVSH